MGCKGLKTPSKALPCSERGRGAGRTLPRTTKKGAFTVAPLSVAMRSLFSGDQGKHRAVADSAPFKQVRTGIKKAPNWGFLKKLHLRKAVPH